MPTPLVNKSTGQLEYFDDKLVNRKLSTRRYDFPSNADVFLRLRDGTVGNVTGSEANDLVRGNARWLSKVEANKALERQEYGDSTVLSGVLGLLDYGTLGAAPWITRQLSDEAAESWDKYQNYNPGSYHGAGIIGSIASALYSGTLGPSAGVAKLGTAGAQLGAKELAKRVALGKLATEGLKHRSTLGKAASIAANLNAPAIASRAGLAAHKVVANFVAKRGVGAKIPGFGKSLKDLSPVTANLISGTTGTIAAGMVEGGIYGAGEGLSEASLGNLDNVAEHVLNTMTTNALIGGAVSGGFGAGIPLLGKLGTATMKAGGGIAGLVAGSGASKATTDAIARMGMFIKKGGAATTEEIKEAQLMLNLGEEGRKARIQSKKIASTLSEITERLSESVDESFLVEELLQQADKAGMRRTRVLQIIQNPMGDAADALPVAPVALTLQRMKDQVDRALVAAQQISEKNPLDTEFVEPFIKKWTTAPEAIGFATGGQRSNQLVEGWADILNEVDWKTFKESVLARDPGMAGQIDKTISEIMDSGDVNRFISFLNDAQMTGFTDSAFTAAVWSRLEDISNEFFGMFGGKLTSQATDIANDLVEKDLRPLLKSENLFGNMGIYKQLQDKARKDFSLTHKDFRSKFMANDGLDNFADQTKIFNWMRSLRINTVKPKTRILQSHATQGQEVLEMVMRDYDLQGLTVKLSEKLRQYVDDGFTNGTLGKSSSPHDIEIFFNRVRGKLERSNDKLNKDIDFITSEAGSALRWTAVNAQTMNSRAYLPNTNTFLPYVGGLTTGMVVNAAESIIDPAVGASRLFIIENMARKGIQETDGLVNKYINYLSTGGEKRIAPKSISRAFVLPAASQRDVKGAKQEEEKRKKQKAIRKKLGPVSSRMTIEQFKETRDFLTYINTSPVEMESFLDASVADLGDNMPETKNAIKSLLRNRLSHAYRVMPSTANPGFLDDEVAPTTIELAKFSRTLEALNQPVDSLVNALSNGTATDEVIEAIRIAAPNIFADVQTKVIEKLSEPGTYKRISRADRLNLARMFQIPVMNPESMAVLRTTFQPKQEGPGRPPGMNKPMRSTVNTGTTMTSIVERA
jgi:hypothetical protein